MTRLPDEPAVPLNSKWLELLVCPVTKASLVYRKDHEELWCRASGLAYPIHDGIPVMLEEEARELTQEERDSLRD
jgi:uncharacterized protein YbaR (Trm112 family)